MSDTTDLCVPAPENPNATGGTPVFDADSYRDHLAELELSPEQEAEVLGVLFEIMRSFAEIGWGVDPVQTIFEEMARRAILEDLRAKDDNRLTAVYEQAANREKGGANGE